MMVHACLLVLGVLFPAAAAAETVYKYRQPDGKMIYSNRLIPGAELVETFEYRFPKAVAPDPKAKKRADEVDQRIQKHLLALDRAWTEVQDATRALTAAEEKLRAGVEPQPGDRAGVTGDTIPPVVGGAGPSASPAIGGSMSGRRGRASPEYVARIQALEGAVREARARLDTALRNYNALR